MSGKVWQGNPTAVQTFHVTLDDQLTKFWENEEIPQKANQMTDDENACARHFEETTIVKENRFIVQIPFKTPVFLCDSFEQAKTSFSYLKRKLDAKTKKISSVHSSVFDMYQIEEVLSQKVVCAPDKCYYLPEHCAFKDSTTTKLRVVFDVYAMTTDGISINEAMMVSH